MVVDATTEIKKDPGPVSARLMAIGVFLQEQACCTVFLPKLGMAAAFAFHLPRLACTSPASERLCHLEQGLQIR